MANGDRGKSSFCELELQSFKNILSRILFIVPQNTKTHSGFRIDTERQEIGEKCYELPDKKSNVN